MLCKKCGADNRKGVKFCEDCGTQLYFTKYTNSRVGKSILDFANETDDCLEKDIISRIVVKNDKYFINAFRQLAVGRNKFNFAAFFLGPYYALYRKDLKGFKRLFLPIIIFQFLAIPISEWMLNMVFVLFSLPIILYLCSIGYLAALIFYGSQFNKMYYKEIKKDVMSKQLTISKIETDLEIKEYINIKYGTTYIGVIIYCIFSAVTYFVSC